MQRAAAGTPSVIGNVIWIIIAGIWLAIGHVVTAVGLALSACRLQRPRLGER